MTENPFQSPTTDGPPRPRRASRPLLVFSAMLAALLTLAAYRLLQASLDGSPESVQRGLILCGVLGAALIVSLYLSRSR